MHKKGAFSTDPQKGRKENFIIIRLANFKNQDQMRITLWGIRNSYTVLDNVNIVKPLLRASWKD